MPFSKFKMPTYSHADVLGLCQTAGLKPKDHEAFRQELENCAAVYRWEANKHKDGPNNRTLKRELAAMQTRLSNLRSALDGASPDAKQVLRNGISLQAEADTARMLTQTLSADTPNLLFPSLKPDEFIAFDLTDIEKILGGLDAAFQATIEQLPKQPRGQGRDHGLRLWITNIKDLWERTTTAPFTRDATEANEPLTPAATFCVDAFHKIEPDYQNSRIFREMKSRITKEKIAGRIMPKTQP